MIPATALTPSPRALDAAWLSAALSWTPRDQQLAVSHPGPSVALRALRSYPWVQAAQRLHWRYGPAETLRRLNGGVR